MSQTGLASTGGMFEIEQEDDTIIVVPAMDLRELDYQRIEDGATTILELLNGANVKNVVLDFHKTDYFGSTALGIFMKLWKRVSGKHGRMALCNISDNEKEILQIMKLDHFWPICPSRIEALAAVRQ
jgi:anti-anti-sigma factor